MLCQIVCMYRYNGKDQQKAVETNTTLKRRFCGNSMSHLVMRCGSLQTTILKIWPAVQNL